MSQDQMVHWADMTADRVIKQKGDRAQYVVASGITPSGVVHFGNFREAITVDFVARALRARGKKVRFIFSWDNFDTFRKVPANMPNQDLLATYLFRPIVDTPDPYGKAASYAAHHMQAFEAQLKKMGIEVEFLYQAENYRSGKYREAILKTLKAKDQIREILNRYRTEPLAEDFLPISIYCQGCHTDHNIGKIKWNGANEITYHCNNCQHQGKLDLQTTQDVKLPWREDWPMRWAFEQVDFEPGGKDHSSQGGSYDTAKVICKEVFGHEPPIYLQYDFVSFKGMGGKMSSSSGNLVTVNDVLKIYEPEMVRWIFASYKSNVDFALSFDLDVVKNYEDFDRQERLAYGVEAGNEKKVAMAKRVLELAQIGPMPTICPFQPSFRHLCNLLQINDFDTQIVRKYFADQIKNERDERRYMERSERAKFWIENYAPEDFKFQLRKTPIEHNEQGKAAEFLTKLRDLLGTQWEQFKTDKDLHEKMYESINQLEMEPMEAFKATYHRLIGRDNGPKLAGFILAIGKKRVLELI